MEYIRGRLVSIHFDSMVDFHNMEPSRSNQRIHNQISMRGFYEKWTGPTIMGAMDAIEKSSIGDHELYENYLMGRISEINNFQLPEFDNRDVISITRRRRVKRAFGDEIDMQAVYRGDLERAWGATERIQIDQEYDLVTILIDIGGNANIRAIDTLWTAAACLKVVDDLQQAGKNVQVIVGGSATKTTTDGFGMTVSACVKKYNEHLSVERLAAMSHIGFYRTFGFIGKTLTSKKLVPNLGHHIGIGQQLPIPLQDEIKEGRTRLITMPTARSFNDAIYSIKHVYAEMTKGKQE